MDLQLQNIAAPCQSHYSRVGYTDRPEDFMCCADVFCLPSYREGFGSVIIEAASVGLPAIASRIYGLVDAVVDFETGILHEAKNIRQIQDALMLLAKDTELRQTMARQARTRAHGMFNQTRVTDAMRDFYRQILR
jgi:glycosyltransferase involved in cell wall biosynthesis